MPTPHAVDQSRRGYDKCVRTAILKSDDKHSAAKRINRCGEKIVMPTVKPSPENAKKIDTAMQYYYRCTRQGELKSVSVEFDMPIVGKLCGKQLYTSLAAIKPQ